MVVAVAPVYTTIPVEGVKVPATESGVPVPVKVRILSSNTKVPPLAIVTPPTDSLAVKVTV